VPALRCNHSAVSSAQHFRAHLGARGFLLHDRSPKGYYAAMSPILILLWTVAVSLCALGAAYYARKTGRADAIIALYVTLVVASNLVASKIVGYDIGFTTLFAPGATLLFSVTFLLTDIVNEKFGRQETQRMIYIAVFAQLAFLLFAYIAVSATPAPFFAGQAAFESVFAMVPRIAAAGLITFLVSESLDAYLYQWFRLKTHGRSLWLRNAFSSVPAMLLDSTLFVILAFYGTTPILPLIIGLTSIKWIVAVIDIPFMYAARAVLGTNRN
jgi:queuosine precursor transporter